MTEHLALLALAVAGRYSVKGELGAGGMATVYLALDLKHDRKVALKVLRPELTACLGAGRFLREIKVTAQLNHPHIVPLLDSGEADDLVYYVMPFVDGESLRGRLNREKQLPISDAVRIAIEVADALAAAHERGIIHRDIKPENVLLERGHAVVADFGISKAVNAGGGEKLTDTGIAVGTPHYMSPEQASGGTLEVDGRTDLYALGCMLHEMLAGAPPFTAPTAESVIRQHITNRPPPITNFRPSVGPRLANVVDRALAKTPADRFRDTSELMDALRAAYHDLAHVTATSRTQSGTTKGAKHFGPTNEPISVRARFRIHWRIAMAALVGLVIVIGAWQIGYTLIAGHGLLDTPTIAVLALDNFTGDPEREYLAESMTDQITAELGKVSGLFVKSRTSAMAFKGSDLPLTEIGRQLGAHYIVEGSLGPVSDSVHVTVLLIDATEDRHIWSNSYESALGNGFALTQDIARAIAGEVRVVLTPDEQVRLLSARQVGPEAFDAFQRGMYHLYHGGPDRSGALDDAFGHLDLSIGYFQRAIKADAEWAKAHAMLAQAYQWYASSVTPTDDRRADFYQKSRASAHAALALDDTEYEANLALAFVAEWYDGDWTQAEEYYHRVSELAPNYNRWGHALGLYRNGRIEEAIDMYTLAEEQDPTSLLLKTQKARANLCAGNHEAALREAMTVVDLNPELMQAQRELGRIYLAMGMYDEAIPALRKSVDLGGNDRYLGYAYALAGFPDEARDILAARAERGAFSPGIWIFLDDTTKALNELTEMFRIGRRTSQGTLRCIDWYKRIKDDVRFVNLTNRFNIPRQWLH